MKKYLISMKSIAFQTFTVILFASIMSCSEDDSNVDCKERIDPNVVCITLYDPVCGCNNKTYSNSCVATASGISTFTKGECGK